MRVFVCVLLSIISVLCSHLEISCEPWTRGALGMLLCVVEVDAMFVLMFTSTLSLSHF